MPVGFRIASAWVDIRAEDKGLRQQIKDAVEKATKGQEAKIELKIDSKGLRREVENALKEATKGQKPKIEIAIKSTGLRREVTDALKRATDKQKPTVKLGINSSGLRREVQRALTEATRDQKPTVRLGISAIGLRGEVQRALAAATAGQDGTVRINARVDTDGLRRALADSHPTITPDIDVRGLRQRMMAAIRQINVNDDVHINPNIDGDAMANQIRSEVARLRDKYRVRIGTDVDTDTFAARIRAAARNVRGDIDIDLNPRINAMRARAEAGAAFRDLRAQITFTGELNTAMTRAKLMASLAAAQAGMHITIPVRYDRKQLQAMFGTIEDGFRSVEGPTGRWSKMIQGGALLALPAFGLLDHAIRTTGASIAVAVPMVTMLASAFAAAKIGMQGMGTVISGIFNEEILTNHQLDVLDVTMKGLAPSALRFANAMKNVRGEFAGLRTGVQQILFTNLDTSLNQFAKQTLPVLKLGLAGTADQLNRMTVNMINVVNTSARTGELKVAFGAVQMAMEPLIPMPGQILNALTKMTIAAAPLLIRMTTSFNGWSRKMTEKLNTAFTDGRLQASVSKAGDVIVNFFRRIANNPEFRIFLDRMKANGPQLSKTFGDIANALLRIINALAPISAVVMKVVDAFAKFVNAIPMVLLEAFIIKLFIFKTALMVTGLIKSVVTALGALKMALIALQGPSEMAAALGPRLAAMGASGAAIRRMAVGLGIFAKVGASLAALYFTFTLINTGMDKLFNTQPVNVDKLTKSLKHFNETGKLSGEAARTFKASWSQGVDGMDKKFGGLQAAIKGIAHAGTWDHIFNGFQKATNWIDPGKTKLEGFKDKLSGVDDALTKMVKSGNTKEANKLFGMLSVQANKAGTSTDKFRTLLPNFSKALKDTKAAQKLATDSMDLFGAKAVEVSGRLKALKADTDSLVQSLFALNNTQRDANQAVRDMETAASAMVAATKKKAIGLKFENGMLIQNTKAQQTAAASIEDYAGKTEKSAIATYEANGNWEQATKTLTDGRKAIIKAAEAAGMGTTAAEAYADSIFKIPSKKEVLVMLVDQATQQLQDVAAAFRAAPEKKVITVSTLNNAAIKGLQDLGYQVKQLPDGSFTVTAKTAPAEADLEKIEKFKIDPKTVEVFAKITAFTMDIQKAQAKVDSLKQKRKTAVGADKAKLDAEIKKAQKEVDDLKQKRKAALEAIDKTGPGVSAAQRALNSLHDKSVAVTVVTSYQQIRNKGYNGNSATGGHATGGFIKGAGSGTSDSILARLSNGEFVLTAASVKKYGLNFLNSLNKGKMPKFAGGGAVSGFAGGGGVFNAGTAVETLTVKANTTDVISKLGKVTAALAGMNKQAPKAVSIRATDNTKKAADSAKANFRSIPTTSQAAYNKIKGQTSAFGNSLAAQMNGVKGKNASVWNSIGTSLHASITGAYNKVKSATSAFGNNTVSSITGIKTRSNAQWGQFQSEMTSKTNKTYSGIKNATNAFGSQNVAKFKSIVGSTGSAWGGLSGKFKPPISYLIHTIINKGVVGGMNAIIGKLGGGSKVGGVSVGGFATGGPISGAGSKTSDSILARLSHGEFVMQAAAVDKYGSGFMHAVNHGQLPGFAGGGMLGVNVSMPGFASGGSVPSADSLNKMIGTGASGGYTKVADWVLANIVEPLVGEGPGGSAMKDTMKAGAHFLDKNMATFLEKHVIPSFMGGKIPSGSRLAIINAALKAAGVPPPGSQAQWQAGLNTLITRESGWNAGAINRTDSNAKAGHPSQGLAQTIPGTFNAYVPSSLRSRGILDPVANVAAAVRYIVARYGNITNVQQANASKPPKGYRVGGPIQGPGNGTSDSILARLSNGEYVMTADAVSRYGLGFMNAVNAGSMQLPGFASGGYTKTKGSGKNKRYYYRGKWYTLDGYRKAKSAYDSAQAKKKAAAKNSSDSAKAAADSEKEARSTLKGNVTFSHFGDMAFAQGSFQNNEIENQLGQSGSIAALVDSLNSYASQIRGAFSGSTETSLLKKLDSSGKALLANEKKLEGVNDALDKAKTTLGDLKDKFDSLRDSVSENIKSYGSITKIGKYGTNPQTLLTQLQTDAGKATGFSWQLSKLKEMGVDPELISQIASAGIGEGGATAQTILGMTPEQIAQLNAYQKQLSDAATKAGNTTADAMYGAGIRAAQGLVDGLTSEQKAIEAAMMAIAKSMEAAIKKALGIKSPSRVMMAVADFTVDGLQDQLIARTAGVERVMANLVSPDLRGPANQTPGAVAGTIGIGGSRGHVTNIGVINVNVTGTFNLNTPAERRALAKLLAKDIKEEIRKDDKAHR